MEPDYIEEIKQRFLHNNFSKPEELYPLLMDKMRAEKEEHVIPWLKKNLIGRTILDAGGGSGYLIKDLNFQEKIVVDIREFDKFPDIDYVHCNYSPSDDYKQDVTVFSEFLHLFDHDVIARYVRMRTGHIVIIENKYDDFLDLRLRMWSKGKCIDTKFITKLMGIDPIDLGDFWLWHK